MRYYKNIFKHLHSIHPMQYFLDNLSKPMLKASLLVCLSGILYGFLGFLGSKALEENLEISNMLFWRFIIASLWMLFCIGAKRSKASWIMDKHSLFFTLFLGTFGYAGSSGLYFLASEYTGTGIAMVIFFSYPIMVALLSWVIDQHSFSLKTLLMLIIMTAGLFLLRNNNTEAQIAIKGILLAIGSAALYAFYLVGSKKYSSASTNSNILTMSVCFSCAAFYLTLALANNTHGFPPTFNSWLYLLAIGIFATAIPIQLMLEGLKCISTIRASIISVLEPLVTLLIGVILLEESVSTVQIFGIMMVLGSAILVQFYREL